MSSEQLEPLPGASEEGKTEYLLVSPMGGVDADARALMAGMTEHIDLILKGSEDERINVRYEPGQREVVVQDPTRLGVLHLYGGECYRISEDGKQVGRRYSCDGFISTEVTDHGVPNGILNVYPKEGE